MPKKYFHKKLHIFYLAILILLSLVLIYATAIPLLRSDAWWIRIFDFPRIQIVVLLVLTLGGFAALGLWRRLQTWQYPFVAMMVICLIWQVISIAPYTRFYSKQMDDSQAKDDSNRISLLLFNVLSHNREVQALRDLIRDTDPDLILLSEPTDWWLEQLSDLEKDYPYTVFQPQDNQYGKLLYSRLELINPEVRFLIESEIPSLRSQIRLRSGTVITFYGVHPRPPGLKRPKGEEKASADDAEGEGENGGERADSDMRDAELMVVAKEVKKLGDVPVIVAGDFNDVAWSHTSHLFQRLSGSLDPRVGRGLYHTFDTRTRLLRYPLDHAFASRHFLLSDLRRLPDIGSDHFPFLVIFDYDPGAAAANDEPQQEAGDEEEAAEIIEEGKTID